MERLRGIGAYWVPDWRPYGWLPPLTYDFYIVNRYSGVPIETYQYLKDNGKKIGMRIQQEVHPWPEISRIDFTFSYLGEYPDFYQKYLEFCIIYEENPIEFLQELNHTYDYIKSTYPTIPVFQHPGTGSFDFSRIGELKADGFIINPRWVWSSEFPVLGMEYFQPPPDKGFEAKYLFPVLQTGKPVINDMYLGWASDGGVPQNTWKYAIGQYKACLKYGASISISGPFHPDFEQITQERLEYIQAQIPKNKIAWLMTAGLSLSAIYAISKMKSLRRR